MDDTDGAPPATRLFVLLAWHPVLGMTAQPVGVLGVALRPRAGPDSYVSWIPLPGDVTGPWAARLTRAPSAAQLTAWLDARGIAQMEELASAPAGSLPQAVEELVDVLLAEVIPNMPAYPQGASQDGE